MLDYILVNYPDIVDTCEMIILASIGITIGGKILKIVTIIATIVAVSIIAYSFFNGKGALV